MTSAHSLTAGLGSWLELPGSRSVVLSGRCAIGREQGNDLVLEAPTLSRRHALIVEAPGGHVLTDLHSRNGTYVNEQAVDRPVVLRDNDVVRFGDVMVRFRCVRSQEPGCDAIGAEPTFRLLEARPRDCWVLVADVAGFSALNDKVGSPAALQALQSWIFGISPRIAGNGGTINTYAGDAILAWWPAAPETPLKLLRLLRELAFFRSESPVPFRVVLHVGQVLFTRSDRGEELSGQDVNFAFRAEKVAKSLGAAVLLTAPAAAALGPDSGCALLATSAVDGIPGQHSFFSAPR
jgi:class 3 adenylate cyclase